MQANLGEQPVLKLSSRFPPAEPESLIAAASRTLWVKPLLLPQDIVYRIWRLMVADKVSPNRAGIFAATCMATISVSTPIKQGSLLVCAISTGSRGGNSLA